MCLTEPVNITFFHFLKPICFLSVTTDVDFRSGAKSVHYSSFYRQLRTIAERSVASNCLPSSSAVVVTKGDRESAVYLCTC